MNSWQRLSTPALLVDTDRLDRNIEGLARQQRAAGVSLRPHFKTSKCLEVARRQLSAGAIGLTCSTPAEVAALSEAGVRGLIWAHLPVGPAKVAFAAEAARQGVLLMVDSLAVAQPLAAAGVEADVLIEVDTGHGRSGVQPERAVDLALGVQALDGLQVAGVITHEGQLSGHGTDRAALEAAGRAAAGSVVRVAAELAEAGVPCRIVSVGSTPGITSAATADGVTEARAGTYVYFDANQWRLGSASLDQCALSVLGCVVSRPGPGRAIIDAGLKAMSSDAFANGGGIVCGLDLQPLTDISFETANEEHGFLTGSGVDALAVGDLLRIIPNHACGTVNMWSGLWAAPDTTRSGPHAWERWAIVARH